VGARRSVDPEKQALIQLLVGPDRLDALQSTLGACITSSAICADAHQVEETKESEGTLPFPVDVRDTAPFHDLYEDVMLIAYTVPDHHFVLLQAPRLTQWADLTQF
jgi:hypothetical protein